MANLAHRIDELSASLQKLLPMDEELRKKLDKKLRLEFNFNSNHLEGNTLTFGETELLLIFGRTEGNHTKQEYDEMEAHNVAYTLIKEWAADKERPLTESDIKNLHRAILVRPYWNEAITPDGKDTHKEIKLGSYKEVPNSVKLPTGEKFEFASVTDTPIMMGELMQWYRDEESKNSYPAYVIAALFHYKFVRIHPFDDGNGRMARLLMNYILLKNNLPPVVIKSSDKRNYLSALNSADTGNLDSFITYIAKQLEWSLELSVKAAMGENIEEPEDVDKEISMWKKQIDSGSIETVRRNDNVIYHLYNNRIKGLFELFIHKVKQFYDMFHTFHFFIFRNNEGKTYTFESITHKINQIIPNEPKPNDNYWELRLRISLEEFKYNPDNNFSLVAQLNVIFDPYKFFVKFNNRTIIEKKYNEHLTDDEITTLVSYCIRELFNEIKEKTNQ